MKLPLKLSCYVVLIGLSASILAACGQKEVPVLITPPQELRTCADTPAAPSLPGRDGTVATRDLRDQMTLDYILALRSAYGDCAAKVAGLDAWMSEVE